MNPTLTRLDSSDQGTFGQLTFGSFSCYTGELPWRDNAPLISCVPTGNYTVVWTPSPRFRKYTYRLLNVEGRSGVLIHSSNLMGDLALGFRAQLLGCISFGERLGVMDGQKALLVSRPAVRNFEQLMKQQTFILEIRNA